jgi:hypothetical protein
MIQAPQVRDEPETYRSRLMTFLRGNSDVLERLTVEMYAQGLSMRDIEETLEEVALCNLTERRRVLYVVPLRL